MITNQNLINRFIRYVGIDTQSNEESAEQPTTTKQRDLAGLLYSELCEMGVQAVYDEEHCYVYAKLPGEEPAIGFVAHMDTSPAASGCGVTPHIVENYPGGNIVLREATSGADAILLRPSDFPELRNHVGEDLIVTNGTTLLGSDDKSGISEIMNLFEYYTTHPEQKHRTICAAFTPDEEVGRGTENFDIEQFGAREAYTVDGGGLGELEYECFNAAAAKIEITGRSVHPGDAKNTMLNAILIGMEFNALLPANERPEYTEGYEGFYHLSEVKGGVDSAKLKYIIRDHDSEKFTARKEFMKAAAALINARYRLAAGGDVLSISIRDQYYNMAIHLKDHMELITRAKEALQTLGIEPVVSPIRGGTDGAALTYMGIPCPNLCTGGYNFHGRFEYASVQELEKCAELLILLAAA